MNKAKTPPLLDDNLRRIADALERLSPPPKTFTLSDAEGFVWDSHLHTVRPVRQINRLDLTLLKGIDRQKTLLLTNTTAFAKGYPANNVLLWGARGTGKSSLIKSVHAAVRAEMEPLQSSSPAPLVLIEIHREDLESLPHLLEKVRGQKMRCIVFCDDLSFSQEDASYKSLKAILEGGIEGKPDNVLFYATSNRRHLLPRDMIENERSTAIHSSEATDEKVSLSDRFGLWIGFHVIDQNTYLEMVQAYARYYDLQTRKADLCRAALEWSVARGARSGRVAWQFIQHLAGREGVNR